MNEALFDHATEHALRLAESAHVEQTRKGTKIPYVLHPVHVALILARAGESSAVIQAAIMHDVVEDCDAWTIEDVERELGREVAGIVAEVTENKSKTWAERKQHQVDVVPHLSRGALAVKCADKLHNLSMLAHDLEQAADQAVIWARFSGGREKTLAMSRRFVDALASRQAGPLAAELCAAMDRLERAAGQLRRSTDCE